ncbi:MAG: hypothetical protein ABSE48_18120 [Verrucomicrobiota bacterium]|jgi:hypothetical protein
MIALNVRYKQLSACNKVLAANVLNFTPGSEQDRWDKLLAGTKGAIGNSSTKTLEGQANTCYHLGLAGKVESKAGIGG